MTEPVAVEINWYQNVESVKDGNYPDAVLVRKVFAKREKRVERRKWMLKRIIQTKTDVSIRYYNPNLSSKVREGRSYAYKYGQAVQVCQIQSVDALQSCPCDSALRFPGPNLYFLE